MLPNLTKFTEEVERLADVGQSEINNKLLDMIVKLTMKVEELEDILDRNLNKQN